MRANAVSLTNAVVLDAVDLAIQADALDERGHGSVAEGYRTLARLVAENAGLAAELGAVTRFGQLLDAKLDSSLYERFVVTCREGVATDGVLMCLATERERAGARRRRIGPEARPLDWRWLWEWAKHGWPLRLVGAERRTICGAERWTLVLTDGKARWAVQARYYGFLLRRFPLGVWHGPGRTNANGDLGLTVEGERVALLMPVGR
jgi:hypothetical protein